MRKNIMFAMASLAILPAVGHAAAPTLSEVLDASGITATGHATGSFAYARVSPPSPASTVTANTFGFDQAELLVSKLPTEGFGALVDVYAGQDVKGGNYNYAGGFNTFSSGSSEFNLHQAFVQYATGGLTVIGGKFATLAGYEVASDALNTNATRSILFGAQPFTLTGVRAGYKFSDLITVYAGLSNSAAGSTIDGNKQKTTELGVALAPVTGLTVSVTDYIGNEGGTGNKTNLLDTVVAYTLGDLSLGLNGDYNTFKESGITDAKFSGVALYANYQIVPKFRAGLRGEYAKAKDDVPGTDVKLSEVTFTGDYSASKSFDLVSDLRFLSAKDEVANAKTNTTTFVVKAIYKF
jgi:hypothetical protein